MSISPVRGTRSLIAGLAGLVVALFTGVAVAQDAAEAIQPGEAYVTRFSGTVSDGGADQINLEGVVGSIVDVRNPGQAPQGHHWLNEPQRNPVTAGEVGQVFGVAFDDAAAPNVFLTATSAFGLHLAGDGSGWMAGMWGPGGGPGTVWKLNAANGYQPEIFSQVTLDGRENTGAGLGAIVYDRWHGQFLVSDLETGMIHRLAPEDGSDLGRYDHGTEGRVSFTDAETGAQESLPPVSFDPSSAAQMFDCAAGEFSATPSCWNFADFRRRVWGLGLRHDNATGEVRLYYAVWSSQGFGNPDFAAATDDEKRNSVWSIAIAEDGSFDTASVRKEYVLPDFFLDPADIERAGHSNPVSDIEFPECTNDRVMLVAERGGVRNLGLAAENAFAYPHESRVLRYEPDDAGIWRPIGRYDIGYYDRKNDGAPFLRANSAGGVDFGYGYQTDWTMDPAKPDQWVWMSGDALCSGVAPCFNPETGLREDGSEVHGIQGTPVDAYDEVNPPQAAGPYPAEGEPSPPIGPLQSWMVDTDENLDGDGNIIMDELTRNDATRIGDVEIYEPCEAGEEEAGVEEPPVVEFPPDVVEPPVIEYPPVVEGPDLEKTKDGPAECIEGGICSFTITITNLGPADWDGPLTEIDTLPPGAILWDYGPQPEWTCNQVLGTQEVNCSHDWITLVPGQAVQLTMDVLLPFGVTGPVDNCIEDTFLESRDPNDPAVILAIERQLNAWGYAVGPVDGVLDAVTMNSIAILQGDNGLPVTGVPDDALVDLLFPEGTVDINPANDSDCHTVNVLPLPPPILPVLADIQARKFQQTPECLPGGLCTFDLWFINRGPGPWTGSPQLIDQLPPGATLEASSAPWICDQTGQAVNCSHPFELTLGPNGIRSVQLTVRMPANLAPGAQNCAVIDWPPGSVRDTNPANDRECIPVRVAPPPVPDLEAQKTIAGGDCTAGNDCRFDLWFTNRGPGNWTGKPTLVDQLPAGATLKSGTSPWLCTQTGGEAVCEHPDVTLQPFQSLKVSVTVTLPATVPPGTQNCSRIQQPGGVADPLPQNDEACVAIPPSGPQGPPDTQTSQCNSTVESGTDTPVSVTVDLGGFQGTAKFTWEHYGVKDRMKLFAGGQLIHDTQCVGGNGAKEFSAAGLPNVTVVVEPNCDGTTGTLWEFEVQCPAPTQAETPPPPPPSPPPPPAPEPQPEPQPPTNQEIHKTQLGPCEPGGTCEFLLELVNQGPGNWSGFPTISDVLPFEGVELGSWSPASWQCSLDQTAITCTYPEATIPPGSAIGVTLSLHMPEELGEGMENCAVIGDGFEPPVDANPSDDQACVPISVSETPEIVTPKPPAIIRPPVVCPPGMRLHDGVCLPPVLVCPPGTHLDHGVCVRNVLTCPPGTHLVRGLCVRNVLVCPPGTHLDHGICVRNVTYCPPGTHLVRGICVRNVVVCPPGTHLDHGICVRNVIHCPAGTYLDHGECVRKPQTCPAGTHLDHGKCVPNRPVCTSGYHLQNGKCVPNHPTCKAGFHLQNGKCVPNRPTCKAGFHLQNGKCVPNRPTCKAGFHLQNGKCVPNRPTCKKGYHLQNGRCVPNKAAKPVCKKGFHLQNGRCVPNKAAGCPPGTRRIGKVCVRVKGPATPH